MSGLRHSERRQSRLPSTSPRRSALPWTSRSARPHRSASALPQPLLSPTHFLPSCLLCPGSVRPTNLTPRQGTAARRLSYQRSSRCAPARKSLHAGEPLDAAAPQARSSSTSAIIVPSIFCPTATRRRSSLGYGRTPIWRSSHGIARQATRVRLRPSPACPASRRSLAPPAERAPDAGALVGRRSCPPARSSRPHRLGGSDS